MDGIYWRADAFGAVMRNPSIPTEPYLQTVLRSLHESPLSYSELELASFDDSRVAEQQKIIKIGIGQLPVISIGSIWKDVICQPIAAEEKFKYQSLQISKQSIKSIPPFRFVGTQI